MSVLKPGKAQELVENIQPFQNAPIISCVHCLFLLWSVASSGRLLNVTFSVENSRALSVKFILPPLFFYFVQWHAGTRSHVGNPCVMDLFYQFHVICGQEFKAFFYVWDGLCSLFFPPPAWDCVCWGVSVIFIFSLSLPVKFSALWIFLSHPFIVSIFIFSTCN